MLASRVKVVDRDVSQVIYEYIITVHGSNEKECIVHCVRTDGTITCSCKKFDSEGILCCHSLKVYSILDIMEIPERYILSRWTRGVKSRYALNVSKSDVEENRHTWLQRMQSQFLRVSYQASMDEITRASVEMMLNECNKKVSEFAVGKEVAIEEEIEINVDQRMVNMKG